MLTKFGDCLIDLADVVAVESRRTDPFPRLIVHLKSIKYCVEIKTKDEEEFTKFFNDILIGANVTWTCYTAKSEPVGSENNG